MDETQILQALDFLTRLAAILRQVEPAAMEPFAIKRGDNAWTRSLKEAFSGRGKRQQVRTFVGQLLAVWQAAAGVPISTMKVGNPGSGPGKLLRFMVAASVPILEIPTARRGTIGPSSLRTYAAATINFAKKYGDEAGRIVKLTV